MPYIKLNNREKFSKCLDDIRLISLSPGELNYLISNICHIYLTSDENLPSYSRFNDIIGVLECAKLEYYRRVVSEYEEKCIEKNGDVF
jgi:hypothetical protein